MRRGILVPCGGFDLSENNPLWELMFIESDQLSIREAEKIEVASSYGELYWAELVTKEGGAFSVESDIGCPENKYKIEFPSWVTLKTASICMMQVGVTLMSVEGDQK